VAEEYKDKKGRLKIIGHTDDLPVKHAIKRYGIKTNLELGLFRAKNVMLELLKGGISEERMYIESYGASQPIVPNTSKENRQKNRRVEIMFEE
jgi:flagellar motor protein MotB